MAKKRKTDKFYPLQRKDVDSLFASSPEPNSMQFDFGRQGHFVRPTKPPETILRWFRVLIDSEAAGASVGGDIPEAGLEDNDMQYRNDTVCETGSPAAEPEPSMWGRELTRYNCGVRYSQRRKGYELIRFPAIKSDADLTAIGDALKDERVLCWWNSNSGHWEAITGEGGASVAQPPSCCIEFGFLCDLTVNECCLVPGMILSTDNEVTTDYCEPQYCLKKVWMWCYQQPPAGAILALPRGECGFAKHLKYDHDCNGDVRDVYGYDCGTCECPCPGDTVKVTLPTQDGCFPSPKVFEAKCVTQDPIAEDGLSGWWGEIEMTGDYPMVGVGINIEPITIEEQSVDHLLAVPGCRVNPEGEGDTIDLCRVDRYYWDDGGDLKEYFGQPFEFLGGSGIVQPIYDASGCVLTCERTFRYGMFFRCSGGNISDVKLYHLRRPGSSGTTDPCLNITVPLPEDAIDPVSVGSSLETPCCRSDSHTADVWFGFEGSCEADLIGSTPPATMLVNPYEHHVLGGCRSWIEAVFDGVTALPEIDTCSPVAAADAFFDVEFDWNEELLCPAEEV